MIHTFALRLKVLNHQFKNRKVQELVRKVPFEVLKTSYPRSFASVSTTLPVQPIREQYQNSGPISGRGRDVLCRG